MKKSTNEKSTKKGKSTKSKVQKVIKEKKPTKDEIIAKEKSDAIGIIDSLSKSDTAFGNSWRMFSKKFEDTIDALGKYQKYLEEKKQDTLDRRNETLEAMKHIVPKLKEKLGQEGSVNKIAYIIGANIEAGSISLIRRLLDRYQEQFGNLYPKALEDKTDEDHETEPDGRSIKIIESMFTGGRQELVTFLEDSLSAIQENTFEAIQIFLTQRDKVKNMRLVKK